MLLFYSAHVHVKQLLPQRVITTPMLRQEDIDRIIQMAWEDRTPFKAIWFQFGLVEDEVVELMRKNLRPDSWKLWRKRVNGRKTKFAALRLDDVDRFRSTRQRDISFNRITKR